LKSWRLLHLHLQSLLLLPDSQLQQVLQMMMMMMMMMVVVVLMLLTAPAHLKRLHWQVSVEVLMGLPGRPQLQETVL
jgi:uncharacterized membrane protein affecting hemolysin expression